MTGLLFAREKESEYERATDSGRREPVSVYVDDMRAPFGRMIMCHMIADSIDELHEMADRIGVARRWFQGPPKHDPHYDISLSKRTLAVKFGAKEVSQREIVMVIRKAREGTRD